MSSGSPADGPPGLWFDLLPEPVTPRPSLPGDTDADVAIVGAGFTGLWTAYYLIRADPSLRIVVLEAEVAGFGASGRNGGWCSALFAAGPERIARLAGRQAAVDQYRELRRTVDEVGRVTADEGIDAHYVKGGTLALAMRAADRSAGVGRSCTRTNSGRKPMARPPLG